MAAAQTYEPKPGVRVVAVTPIYFVATKLEAFRGRGRGDYRASDAEGQERADQLLRWMSQLAEAPDEK